MVILAAPASVQAQKAAEAVSDGAPHTAVEPRKREHPPAGLGGSAVFGWADDGWVARLEYELLPVMAPHGTFGPLFGFSTGLEYWRDGDDKGFSIPALIVGGVRFLPMRVLVGVGIQVFTLDVVNDDTGVGVWGPIAMASASFDLWGVRVGVDARATRHLLLGAPDGNQLQLGISVGYTWSTVPRGAKPYY